MIVVEDERVQVSVTVDVCDTVFVPLTIACDQRNAKRNVYDFTTQLSPLIDNVVFILDTFMYKVMHMSKNVEVSYHSQA